MSKKQEYFGPFKMETMVEALSYLEAEEERSERRNRTNNLIIVGMWVAIAIWIVVGYFIFYKWFGL